MQASRRGPRGTWKSYIAIPICVVLSSGDLNVRQNQSLRPISLTI